MSFSFSQAQQDGLDITTIENTANGTRIQILPSAGALWHGWLLNSPEGDINLINHYQGGADLKANLPDSYRSAKLSPFACRIPEGKYTYEGRAYEFATKFSDGNAIHGLLFNKIFQPVEQKQEERQASARFHYRYRQDDPGYPFDYDCTITYTLHDDNRVGLETIVKNVSEQTIPMVDGWHPYFTTGSVVDDCQLQFYARQQVEFDDKLIPTGKFLPYDRFWQEQRIGDTELDNAFMLDQDAPQPKCTFVDPRKKIQLHIYPSDHYPVLQLYIPPNRRSIAIETLSGAPDAFNNGIGLVLLSPGETRTFLVTYAAEVG
ncbi:MAG TPA: aldose 1-epimerase [Chitinophagaceae bacterium]|nr:aldose 1-epimerase [Chitinophagaceae bacterium]